MKNMKMRLLFFFVMAVAVMLLILERICYRQIEDIQVDWNRRWGSGDDSALPRPFSIDEVIPTLPEMFRRLDEFLVRSPAPGTLHDANHNSPRGMTYFRLKTLVERWRFKYNWKERASRLNELGPQFKLSINGLDLHYYDIRNTNNASAIPVLLLHGWPGSFTEFAEMVEKLKRTGRYHIVLPSLPGFGFSSGAKPDETFTFLDASVAMAKLMRRLHPSQNYVCQGGDYGSFICSGLAQIDTGRILGVHLNMAVILFPPWIRGGIFSWVLVHFFPWALSASNRQRIAPSVPEVLMRMAQETGYFHIQATKPDTLAWGLDESPVFLLSWIGEKFDVWSDPRYRGSISDDAILDNVMVYWLSRCSASAANYYFYMMRSPNGAIASLLAPVPARTAIVDVPFEIFRPLSFWLKDHRYPKLERYTELQRGGHFLAMEDSDSLVADLEAFISQLTVATTNLSEGESNSPSR